MLNGGEFISNNGSRINLDVVNNGSTFISNGATITGDYIQTGVILQILASSLQSEILGFGIESITNPALKVLGLFDIQGGIVKIDLEGYDLSQFNFSDFIDAEQFTGLNSDNLTFTNYDTDQWTLEMSTNGSGGFGVVFNEADTTPPSGTPEPATLLMLGLGLGAIPFARRFRKVA